MEYRLSDLFNLQMGKTPSRNISSYWTSGKYSWISISDLNNDKYINKTKEKISIEAVKKSGIKVIPANTVIMSFKLSIGKTAITSQDMYSNEAIMAFINKNKVKLSKDYIYYLLQSINWNTNKAVKGKTINKSIISATKVNIPSYKEQLKIAKILDTLIRRLNSKQNQLKKLDELIKARFVEMFGDPISNKKSWKKRLLNDLVDKIGSGATPKGGKESYQDHGISFIRSMNVHDGYFNNKDLAYINSTQAKQLSNVIVQSQDVFINITGASVARSCIVPDDILPARVNQHVSIIRCKSDVLNPIFINSLFLNDSFKRILLSIGLSGGATRQAITKKQLEMLKIILPPLPLQNEFANFVQQVNKSKFENIVYLNKTLSRKILSQIGDVIRD